MSRSHLPALSVVVLPTLDGPSWLRLGSWLLVAAAASERETAERVRVAQAHAAAAGR